MLRSFRISPDKGSERALHAPSGFRTEPNRHHQEVKRHRRGTLDNSTYCRRALSNILAALLISFIVSSVTPVAICPLVLLDRVDLMPQPQVGFHS